MDEWDYNPMDSGSGVDYSSNNEDFWNSTDDAALQDDSQWNPDWQQNQGQEYQQPSYGYLGDQGGGQQDQSTGGMNLVSPEDWRTGMNQDIQMGGLGGQQYDPMQGGSMGGGFGAPNDYSSGNQNSNAYTDWASMLKNMSGFSTGGSALGAGSSGGAAGGQSSSMLQSLLKGNGNGALGSLAGIGGVQALMKLYQASQEKKKNAQYEQDAQKSLEGQRAYLDPYAQQRAYMNQRQMEAGDRLNNLYSNPTGNPLYQSSLAEMQRRVPRQFSKNRFSMGANRAMSQQAPELLAKAMGNERDNIKAFSTNYVPNGANEAVQSYLAAQKNNLTNPQNQAINDILQTMKQDGGQNDILNALLGRG